MNKFKTELQRRASMFRGRDASKDSLSSDSTLSATSQPETPGVSSPEMAAAEDVFSPSTSIGSASSSRSDMALDRVADPPKVTGVLNHGAQGLPSALAPVVSNVIKDQVLANQVVVLHGSIPAPHQTGILTLRFLDGTRPETTWAVKASQFKAVAYLEQGRNRMLLDFQASGDLQTHTSELVVEHNPLTFDISTIKPVLLLAKDSKFAKASNGHSHQHLCTMIAKFRMAAYLWQAFIGNFMEIKEYGRRTIQYQNIQKQSTLYSRDLESLEMRNEAPVYIVMLEKSTDELKELSEADLLRCAEEALMKRFSRGKTPQLVRGRRFYCACAFLDAEWDFDKSILRGGIAYGGRGKLYPAQLSLALFGGHLISSYPSSIDKIEEAFSDETLTPHYPAATKAKCASLGIGAHLKQVGYMLGLQNRAFGIMSDDHADIRRVFTVSETQQGHEPCLHPLDIIHLRHHPLLFTLPLEHLRVTYNTGNVIWGADKSEIFIDSGAGITGVEIWLSGDSVCHSFIDLMSSEGAPLPNYRLRLVDIRKQIPPSRRPTRFLPRQSSFLCALRILTADGKSTPVIDFSSFATSLVVALPGKKCKVSRSQTVGTPTPESSRKFIELPPSPRLRIIRVYHTASRVLGLEFVFEVNKVELLGSRAGVMSEFAFNEKDCEHLVGMTVRVKHGVVCGLKFSSSLGGFPHWCGDTAGGERYKFVPPPTYRFAGIEADVGDCGITALQVCAARH